MILSLIHILSILSITILGGQFRTYKKGRNYFTFIYGIDIDYLQNSASKSHYQ